MFKKTLPLLFLATHAFANVDGSQASAASADLASQGISQVVSGSANVLVAGSQIPIVAIRTVGDITYLTLRAVGQSTTVTLRIASNIAGHALIGTGQLLKVVATGSGVILTSAGHLIAFIPNELGKSLLYSDRI